jgi:hypothetical protein
MHEALMRESRAQARPWLSAWVMMMMMMIEILCNPLAEGELAHAG